MKAQIRGVMLLFALSLVGCIPIHEYYYRPIGPGHRFNASGFGGPPTFLAQEIGNGVELELGARASTDRSMTRIRIGLGIYEGSRVQFADPVIIISAKEFPGGSTNIPLRDR